MNDNWYIPSEEWIAQQAQAPDWWKGDVADVEEVVKTVRRGRVRLGCQSPGGRNVYVVEYGAPNEQHRTATYSSALGARSIHYYSDKTDPDYRPCVFFIGCVHGGEFEGTVAILNLIQLLETGKDFAGNENADLVALAEQCHLILIPCVNPDGRSHFPFKSALGMDYTPFRYYDQGMWLDGTMCDWPQVKKIHPIKDHVKYLGGYFNDDGINLMHDNFFNPMAKEVRLMLDVAYENAPDFIINFHGACGCNSSFCDGVYLYTSLREEVETLEFRIHDACGAEGIPFTARKKDFTNLRTTKPTSVNLTWALHHVCGGISLTHESQQGVINNPPSNGCTEWGPDYWHIYREHMICMAETIRFTKERLERQKV